jgi:UDP-N-acetylmuramoylalanine--D-glutamate ligase
MSGRALVVGYGLSGRAAARWLVGQGWRVVVLEDDAEAGEAAKDAEERDYGAGVLVIEVAPRPARAGELAREADLVVPSPGVAVAHPAVVAALAAGVEVCSEIELAWGELARWRAAGAPPGTAAPGGAGEECVLVAITGTNGKTTVTKLAAAMLSASGRKAIAAGNVGYPLLEAVGTLGLAPHDISAAPNVLVAEVSSFQLEYTRHFRPDVSCWLNFSPDHLDWHPSLDHYAHAKSKIWDNQGPGSTVVINADDPVVVSAAATVPAGARVVTFGSGAMQSGAVGGIGNAGTNPTWSVSLEAIEGPGGTVLTAAELPRALPHDMANTAAAMAIAMAAGASEEGCLQAARVTPAPPHRVEFVAEGGGVAWYDDSKATTPASVLAGVRGFCSVVLIAGGRNKGLDLSPMARAVPPVRAVIAIGEATGDVAAAFAGVVPVLLAMSMEEAVQMAADVACPGDSVVLSPGCASFDWYTSYVERGEHFASLVKAKLGEVGYR